MLPDAAPHVAAIAVVGCGSWATEAHLPAIERHPRARLAGVCDVDEGARTAAAERFGAPAFATVEELLQATRPDAVVVAIPHSLHHPVARAVLEAGAHVLIEKPMVLDPAHGRELLELARRQGRELLVGYTWHYNAQLLDVRRRLADGAIGTLEHVTCLFASTVREYYRGDTESYQPVLQLARAPRSETYSDPALAGGGQGQTQLTHSAALLLFLTGLQVETVAAFTASFDLPVDLVDAVAIRFAGGAVGTLASTGGRRAGGDDLLELRLFGDAGEVLVDVMAGEVAIRTPAGTETLPVPEPDDRYPLHAPAENLIEVALGLGANGSPGAIGQATVELLDAMYRSATARRRLDRARLLTCEAPSTSFAG